MEIVKASGWHNSNLTEEAKVLLIKSGIIPVNDVFYDNWGNRNKINLYYGGYGSGKSDDIQTQFLIKAATDPYFRGYYGRKVLEDVRGSVHSVFVSLIERLGMESQFKYSKEPNGSMVIIHRVTGNKIMPFGAGNAQGLKSIDNPTHFFLEEMDQFTLKDFGVIISRLRTKKAFTQLYGAFNTATVMEGHWIKKVFFDPPSKSDTEAQIELRERVQGFGVNKIFCNYTDNYFIDQEDYYNKLVIGAGGDDGALKSAAAGAWGSALGDIFKKLKIYTQEPVTTNVLAYIDVADEGADYVAMPIGKIEGKKVYITDVVYSNANTDVTIPLCEQMLKKETVKVCRVESNSMGAMFGREIAKRCKLTKMFPHVSTANKLTRIRMNSYFVLENFYFKPADQRSQMYSEFVSSLVSFTMDGKNKNDDAPDAITGLAELVQIINKHEYV